jgi:hypothetical protein
MNDAGKIALQPGADKHTTGLQRSYEGPIVLQAHLAAKQAVDDDEVHGGKDHSDAPPD